MYSLPTVPECERHIKFSVTGLVLLLTIAAYSLLINRGVMQVIDSLSTI